MRLSVGYYPSALAEYTDPTGKPCTVKVVRTVWSEGKTVKSYLSLPACKVRRTLLFKNNGQLSFTAHPPSRKTVLDPAADRTKAACADPISV